jgi:hypothetical protein
LKHDETPSVAVLFESLVKPLSDSHIRLILFRSLFANGSWSVRRIWQVYRPYLDVVPSKKGSDGLLGWFVGGE